MLNDHVAFIDLETLPGDATVGMDLTRAPGWEDPEPEPKPVARRTVPRNLKDPAKIAAWEVREELRVLEAEKAAQEAAEEDVGAQRAQALEEWRRGSLDPYRGRIALITVAFGERGVQVINCAEDERTGLVQLGELIVEQRQLVNRGLRWVAHRGLGFDFPWLQLRALKYGSTVLASRFHQEKPWDGVLVDTLEWWPQVGGRTRHKRGSLDLICEHLGIKREDNPIRGNEVLDAYVEGRWSDVVAHGVGDVVDLRSIYRVLAEVRGG